MAWHPVIIISLKIDLFSPWCSWVGVKTTITRSLWNRNSALYKLLTQVILGLSPRSPNSFTTTVILYIAWITNVVLSLFKLVQIKTPWFMDSCQLPWFRQSFSELYGLDPTSNLICVYYDLFKIRNFWVVGPFLSSIYLIKTRETSESSINIMADNFQLLKKGMHLLSILKCYWRNATFFLSLIKSVMGETHAICALIFSTMDVRWREWDA